MSKEKVVFDNGGGITLQLQGWAHYYPGNVRQAAEDYIEYLKQGSAEDFDGHEEEAMFEIDQEQISNGGYKVYSIETMRAIIAVFNIEAVNSLGWNNITEFVQAVRDIKESALF